MKIVYLLLIATIFMLLIGCAPQDIQFVQDAVDQGAGPLSTTIGVINPAAGGIVAIAGVILSSILGGWLATKKIIKKNKGK